MWTVDYRQLNQVTKFDAYPMPGIEELLDRIENAEYITTLDQAKGYWQVPMHLEDKTRLILPALEVCISLQPCQAWFKGSPSYVSALDG